MVEQPCPIIQNLFPDVNRCTYHWHCSMSVLQLQTLQLQHCKRKWSGSYYRLILRFSTSSALPTEWRWHQADRSGHWKFSSFRHGLLCEREKWKRNSRVRSEVVDRSLHKDVRPTLLRRESTTKPKL